MNNLFIFLCYLNNLNLLNCDFRSHSFFFHHGEVKNGRELITASFEERSVLPSVVVFLRGYPECTLAWRRQTPALIERMNELTTQRGLFDFCSIFSTKCLSDCLQDLSRKYMALSGGLTSLLCVERISPPFSTHTPHICGHTHTYTPSKTHIYSALSTELSKGWVSFLMCETLYIQKALKMHVRLWEVTLYCCLHCVMNGKCILVMWFHF